MTISFVKQAQAAFEAGFYADEVRQAGDAALDVYQTDFSVRGKADASLITEADERAEALITATLQALLPGVPVVAEEAVANDHRPEMVGRIII